MPPAPQQHAKPGPSRGFQARGRPSPIPRNPRVGDALRVATFAGDAALFFATQVFVFWLRLQTTAFDWILRESTFLDEGASAFDLYVPHFVLGTMLFLAIGAGFRIYSRNAYLRPHLVLGDLLKTCLAWTMGYLLFSFFFRIEPSISRAFVVLSGGCGVLVLTAWRVLFNRWVLHSGVLFHVRDRFLIIGWTKETDLLWQRARKGSFREMEIVGVVPVAGSSTMPAPKELPVLGMLKDLDDMLAEGGIDTVLLADTALTPGTLSSVVQSCHREMVRFMAIPAFFEVLVSGLHLESLRGVPVLSLGRLPLDRLTARVAKRATDIAGALVGLVLSAPVIVLFAWLVRRESPGPFFYSQVRVGQGGREFRIHKIRSMRVDAEQDGPQWAREGDDRRLRIGTFMRKWNIDELPQFWNVLKGEMSLVGPRPERPEFIRDFKHSVTYYNVRHTVKPGVTGWAAVNGWRGNTDLGERIRFDLDYIERWSLMFDFYIMVLTFFRNKNAY